MIFVTVGTQLAFDRLISAMDTWCGEHPNVRVFAQIGPSELKVEHMDHATFVTPEKANSLFLEASVIVAHAGMGSILTALKYRKPILIVPRKASLGEHRNEHQLATAKWLANRPGISVARDESEIAVLLDQYASFQGGGDISDNASPELIARLRNFISS